ncbi:hypothetical protein ACH5RR_018478, partial [Cinchona calisaya]
MPRLSFRMRVFPPKSVIYMLSRGKNLLQDANLAADFLAMLGISSSQVLSVFNSSSIPPALKGFLHLD